jgi:ferritin-like metal-binding protein YciE
MSAHTTTTTYRPAAQSALERDIDRTIGRIRRLEDCLDAMSYGRRYDRVEAQLFKAQDDLSALYQQKSRLQFRNVGVVF